MAKKINHILGFIASDHRGYDLKEYLKTFYPLIDLGAFSCDKKVDYPDYAKKLCKYVLLEKKPGILIFGSGIGMSIAANKIKGIRAALCRTIKDAELARLHNDANVLVLSGDFTKLQDAKKIAKVFFETEFSKEERHLRRIKKLDK
jgi:2-polyprenyl-6-hydroxyphenyl methylase/3-demethylubiquinone-9 3-methyltransferase